MILLANILNGLAYVLGALLQLYFFILLGRFIFSWVNADPYNAIVRFLISSTEPLLKPIRNRLPAIAGSLDLSPLILMLGLYFLQIALVQTLVDYADSMRRKAQFSEIHLGERIVGGVLLRKEFLK